MRRVLFFLLILLVFFGCKPKNPNDYYIDGSVAIDSLEGKWVYLVPSFNEIDVVLDSCVIEKNKFKMNGNVGFNSYLALLIVTDSNKIPLTPLIGANIVVEPGTVNVSFNANREPTIGGSPQNDLLQRCDDAISNFNSHCNALVSSNMPYEEKYREWQEARKERNDILLSVIEGHINSEKMQALFLEYYTFFNKEELERIERRMNENTRSNARMQMALNTKNVAVGEKYIDFILPSYTNGKDSLASYVGKNDYTLVDFWASWCAPCIRELNSIMPIYRNAKESHFEIVGVSLDSDCKKWKSSIVENNFDFKHLNEKDSWASPIVSVYSISYLPNSVLIDREGYIVSRNPHLNELKILIQQQ